MQLRNNREKLCENRVYNVGIRYKAAADGFGQRAGLIQFYTGSLVPCVPACRSKLTSLEQRGEFTDRRSRPTQATPRRDNRRTDRQTDRRTDDGKQEATRLRDNDAQRQNRYGRWRASSDQLLLLNSPQPRRHLLDLSVSRPAGLSLHPLKPDFWLRNDVND